MEQPDHWEVFVRETRRWAALSESADECRAIVDATIRKMATIARRTDPAVYVQTGLAQIGLELGWRLARPDVVAAFYALMPVSLGVVLFHADVPVVQERNRMRRRNFADRVPAMEVARKIGEDVLMSRCVPTLLLDTSKPIDASRKAILAFVDRVSGPG